jgi:hypothetical protein
MARQGENMTPEQTRDPLENLDQPRPRGVEVVPLTIRVTGMEQSCSHTPIPMPLAVSQEPLQDRSKRVVSSGACRLEDFRTGCRWLAGAKASG